MQSYPAIFSAFIFLASCQNTINNNPNKPIILGDSTTIITERDSQYLVSYIPDYNKPAAINQAAEKNSKSVQTNTDTVKPVIQTNRATVASNGKGLEIPFKNVSIFVPGIAVLKPSKELKNSVAYTLSEGSLSNKTITAHSGSLGQIQQQYTSTVYFTNGSNKYELKDLSRYTSGWEALNNFNTGNLDANKVRNNNPNAVQLKSALQKALNAAHVSKSSQNDLLKSIDKRASATVAPFSTEIRILQWKVKGTGNDNKGFDYRVRFDIPQ